MKKGRKINDVNPQKFRSKLSSSRRVDFSLSFSFNFDEGNKDETNGRMRGCGISSVYVEELDMAPRSREKFAT